jgi:hypothetical protein
MVLDKRLESPDLAIVTMRGAITPGDQAEIVAFVRTVIATTGSARVLLRLEPDAWDGEGRFNREMLWLRHDEGVSRVAVVGERPWRVVSLTMQSQPDRGLPIEYFFTEKAARGWLTRASRHVPQPVLR